MSKETKAYLGIVVMLVWSAFCLWLYFFPDRYLKSLLLELAFQVVDGFLFFAGGLAIVVIFMKPWLEATDKSRQSQTPCESDSNSKCD